MVSIRKLGTIDAYHNGDFTRIPMVLEFSNFRLWLVVLQRLKFSIVTTEFGEPLTSCIYLSIECL